MIEVRFYHLQRTTLERALPTLLGKVLERGLRALVLAGSDERVDYLNQILWTEDPGSFLPHGSAQDGAAPDQPIWLATPPLAPEAPPAPNGAQVLILTDGLPFEPPGFEGLTLVCDLFNGNDEAALRAARTRWRTCKDAGYTLTYWQQTGPGGWERKA